jgi:hypothetical protein
MSWKARCIYCGSEKILFDAYLEWVEQEGTYRIVNVFDKPTICENCEDETHVKWEEVEDND